MSLDLSRDIAIIWLALLCFIALLPPIVILYLMVRGMGEFSRKMPRLLNRVREQNHALRTSVDRLNGRVSKPLERLQERVNQTEATVEGWLGGRPDVDVE